MAEWIKDHVWWVMAFSVVAVVVALGLAVTLAVLIPADYFLRSALPGKAPSPQHPLLRLVLRILKNVLGTVLLLAGFVMVMPLVPGPGLLFLLLGLSLLDIPGKRAVERYLISRPLILRPINALRVRWNRPPLQMPSNQESCPIR